MTDGWTDVTGPWDAPPEVIAARRALALKVHDELMMAGLPAEVEGTLATTGAIVDVDNDDEGGVYVRWKPSQDLMDQVMTAVAGEQFDHPAIEHSGCVAEAMRDAIIAILRSRGFDAVALDGEDDLRGLQVQVLSG